MLHNDLIDRRHYRPWTTLWVVGQMCPVLVWFLSKAHLTWTHGDTSKKIVGTEKIWYLLFEVNQKDILNHWKLSSTSWRGSVQFEARRWWCGSLHFWSESPSQLAGQAIFEGNLPFLWYWWHHSTVGMHRINGVLVQHLSSHLQMRPFKALWHVRMYLFLNLFWAA